MLNSSQLTSLGLSIESTRKSHSYYLRGVIFLRKGHTLEELLHELIHATGPKLRPHVFDADGTPTCMRGSEEHHTEEATAQWGYFMLACHLGHNVIEAHKALYDYLAVYPLADTAKARRQAREAVELIKGVL